MASKSLAPAAVALRLAAGGWVPCSRYHAERLARMPGVRVQYKLFPTRVWRGMDALYEYRPRTLFRACLLQTGEDLMVYEFGSPAELADYLERKADLMVERACQLRNGGGMTQKDVDLMAREAAGVRSAANILRHCRFVGTSK